MVIEDPPLGGDRPGGSPGMADHDTSGYVPGGWDLVHRDWGLRQGESGRPLVDRLARRAAAVGHVLARVWRRGGRSAAAAISPPGGAGSGTRRSSAPRA
jgi:hypothetical protein